MPMPLHCKSDSDILTIFIADPKILDAPTIEQIFKDMVGILEKTQQPNVILDFQAVQFMSSAALGMLIRVNKKCKEFKVNLKLCNIDKDIKQVFKITGLDKVFTIYKNAEEATAAFAKSGSLFHRG
jgi:anti-sigma B factor antagonist